MTRKNWSRRREVQSYTTHILVSEKMSYVDELYSDLYFHGYFLRRAEKELWEYVRTAAWSSEMCARVDEIEAYIRRTRAEIREIRQELGLSPEDPEEQEK